MFHHQHVSQGSVFLSTHGRVLDEFLINIAKFHRLFGLHTLASPWQNINELYLVSVEIGLIVLIEVVLEHVAVMWGIPTECVHAPIDVVAFIQNIQAMVVAL